MEILKKNWLSILCGVIALFALVFLIYPLLGWYSDEQAELDKHATQYNNINSLRKANRSWPVLDLASGNKPPLKAFDASGKEQPVFPSESYLDAGRDIKKKVHTQAEEMKKDLHDFTAEERSKDPTGNTNKLTLLIDGVLPVPGDVRGFAFQKEYVNQVRTVLPRELSGKYPMPPTKEDVFAEAARLWNDEFKNKVFTIAGQPANLPQVADEWRAKCATLQGILRLKRAQDTESKLYLEPNALAISAAMIKGEGAAPQAKDIWYAQSMLWVEQHVAAAIERVNAPARNVMEAPIKHLYRLDVPDGPGQYVKGPSGAGDQTGESGKAFSRTPTGRVCNSMYDVIQFGLSMDVDASKVPAILAELQRGKLITIVHFDLASVDSIALEDDGFIYGNVPVVRLTIYGEELFLRNWTRDFMPPDIKRELGVTDR